jgi:hypothetical protein
MKHSGGGGPVSRTASSRIREVHGFCQAQQAEGKNVAHPLAKRQGVPTGQLGSINIC